MVNRNRNVKLEFWVTEQERDMIAEKMAQYGTPRCRLPFFY